MDWRDHAECRYEDPELFFPVSPTKVAEAKAVCARCPVWRTCLGYAFTTGQDAGIWGGMTEDERRLELLRRFHARTRDRTQPAPRPGPGSEGDERDAPARRRERHGA